MTTQDKDKTTDEDKRVMAQFFHSILTHWIHEEAMYWGQMRTFYVFETAVIAAGYATYPMPISHWIMFVSVFYLIIHYLFVMRIWRTRYINWPIARELVPRFLPGDIKVEIDAHNATRPDWDLLDKWLTHNEGGKYFRFINLDQSVLWIRGPVFTALSFALAILINLCVGYLYWSGAAKHVLKTLPP